jgi:hypothetical protein
MRCDHLTESAARNQFVAPACGLCKDQNQVDKGTPVERRGRKATGLKDFPKTAGLPTQTCNAIAAQSFVSLPMDW